MPARDSEHNLSPSSYPVIADANSAVETIYGTPITGLALQVNVFAVSGSSPTLDIYVHASTSTGDPTTDSHVAGQFKGIAAAGEYIIPFVAPNSRAILVEYDVGGTSPNFSELEAYIIENVGGTWTRLNISV